MMNKNTIAHLLAACAGYYNGRAHLALDEARQVAAVRALNSYGVLSVAAMASVVGCSEYRVGQALSGLPRPRARGKLNPEHLPWLAYMQDGEVRDNWLECMLREGTSISTIADLTGISRSTLVRHSGGEE